MDEQGQHTGRVIDIFSMSYIFNLNITQQIIATTDKTQHAENTFWKDSRWIMTRLTLLTSALILSNALFLFPNGHKLCWKCQDGCNINPYLWCFLQLTANSQWKFATPTTLTILKIEGIISSFCKILNITCLFKNLNYCPIVSLQGNFLFPWENEGVICLSIEDPQCGYSRRLACRILKDNLFWHRWFLVW